MIKRFAVHGHSSSAPSTSKLAAGGSLRLSEPALVLAQAVALVDGVSVEALVAGLIAERGRALGLAALSEAAARSEGVQ